MIFFLQLKKRKASDLAISPTSGCATKMTKIANGSESAAPSIVDDVVDSGIVESLS